VLDYNNTDPAEDEIAEHRWLQSDPASAPEIVKKIGDLRRRNFRDDTGTPSAGTLLLWAKADQAGLIRWADTLDIKKDSCTTDVWGMLLSRVDPATRARWLGGCNLGEHAQG
jgi:hypothetical protein